MTCLTRIGSTGISRQDLALEISVQQIRRGEGEGCRSEVGYGLHRILHVPDPPFPLSLQSSCHKIGPL